MLNIGMQFAKRQIFAVKCQFGQTAKLKAIGKSIGDTSGSNPIG